MGYMLRDTLKEIGSAIFLGACYAFAIWAGCLVLGFMILCTIALITAFATL